MFSPNQIVGKTQCHYCGQEISIKRLADHIKMQHSRPSQSLRPTLVKKTAPTAS